MIARDLLQAHAVVPPFSTLLFFILQNIFLSMANINIMQSTFQVFTAVYLVSNYLDGNASSSYKVNKHFFSTPGIIE